MGIDAELQADFSAPNLRRMRTSWPVALGLPRSLDNCLQELEIWGLIPQKVTQRFPFCRSARTQEPQLVFFNGQE